MALHQFLKEVLVERTGGEDSPYAGCTPDPLGDGPPEAGCPNILKSIKNDRDSNAEWGQGETPLSHISDVELRIPR